MVFDYRSAAGRVGIRPEDVERLATMMRAEFPSDEMMVELHVLRAILAEEHLLPARRQSVRLRVF